MIKTLCVTGIVIFVAAIVLIAVGGMEQPVGSEFIIPLQFAWVMATFALLVLMLELYERYA